MATGNVRADLSIAAQQLAGKSSLAKAALAQQQQLEMQICRCVISNKQGVTPVAEMLKLMVGAHDVCAHKQGG